ncbi:MAG: hypothetical protein J6Q94_06590 [Clostridia bacterium]|nr:hypothetical protein [Clostridia bacterium]
MKKILSALFIFVLLFLLCVSTSAKTVLLGDIDMSGKVTASDARTVLRVSAQLEELDESIIPIADADKNERITSADARKILRVASRLDTNINIELSDTVYVNKFMPETDDLELFAAGCEVKKQDGFVFRYKDEILVLDGGAKNTGDDSVFTYLMNLRKELLPEGVSETDENYKLKITVVLSHFHTDHMDTYIHDIIPSPYIEIDRIYLTEQSVFEKTELYNICDPVYYSDGVIKTKGRLRFLNLLEEFSPETQIVYVPFGETMQIKSDDGRLVFDLFAPSEDWGTPHRASHLLDLYYDGGKSGSTAADFPKAVVNSNSMWMKVSFCDRTMLFTGDVMKKAKNAYMPDSPNYAEEPFDVMLSYYAEKCGEDVFDCDIVKFPHHGQARAAASKGVFEVFSPEFIICTAVNFRETTIANAQKFWDDYSGSYSLSDGNGMHLFTDGKAVTVKKDNGNVRIFDSDGKKTGITGEILVK